MVNYNIIIILLIGAVLMHASRSLLSIWLKLFLAIACISTTAMYLNFGDMNNIFPKDKAYTDKYGTQPKHAYVHWHEIYHYYLGAKYFPEIGYKGMYETIAYADSISEHPALRAIGLRSLRAPTYPIPMAEGLRRGKEEFRPKFTDERWQSFRDDLEAMKNLGDTNWLDLGMFDAGYNPSPSWNVIGNTMANLMPLRQDQAWFGDQSPEWYQIQWLPLFDPLLLVIALGFVTWAFGALGATAFVLFYMLSEPASMTWIAGSFFRWTWFVELMIGLSCLKKRHYIPAGIFFGLTATDRIFPLAFLGAAGVGLLADNVRQRNFRPVLKFGISAAITMAIMVGLSIMMFGTQAWVEFFEKISAHKDLYFVNHIGYRRIAVFGPEVPGQNFWWEEGLNHFREWNAHLTAKWIEVRPLHYVLWAVMITVALYASLRARADEASLMLGGLLFFLFEIPANYYYIYFPMVFVVLLTTTYSKLRPLLLSSFIALWAALWYFHGYNSDDLINNYYKCCCFFAFYCVWVFGRAGETLMWHMRECERPRGERSVKTLEIG